MIRDIVRGLVALSHVHPADVLEAFLTLVADMSLDIRGRRRPERGEHYGNEIFHIPCWNHHQTLMMTSHYYYNSVKGWHYRLQSLFMCHHPTMWTFIAGLRRDCEMSKSAYLQVATGSVYTAKKQYRDLRQRVKSNSASVILSYTCKWVKFWDCAS